MNFRTEITIAPLKPLLPARARVLTMGSCFAAVLGRQLAEAKLPVLENPFGTVLNPVSACRLLAIACGQDDFDLTERTVQRDGRWYSYDAPSDVWGTTLEELERAIHERLAQVKAFVREADALVLTMGTAWAWRIDGEVVANCHKQPTSYFDKSLLSVQETVAAFAEAHSYLIRLNPKLRVVLTVSPVRHQKETLPGSSVSKSTLRLACHHLQDLVRNVSYFPAYELLVDDLRDYRFYAADMLHPTPLAEEYIFDKFVGAYLAPEFAAARLTWEEIRRAVAHRSANPQGEAHQAFLLSLLDRLDGLERQGFAVAEEVATVSAQLVTPRVKAPQREVEREHEPVRPGRELPDTRPQPLKTTKPIIKVQLPPDELPVRPAFRQPPAPLTPRVALPVETVEPPLPTPMPAPEPVAEPVETDAAVEAPETLATANGDDQRPRKRRGRRGGRRNRRKQDGGAPQLEGMTADDLDLDDDQDADFTDEPLVEAAPVAESVPEVTPPTNSDQPNIEAGQSEPDETARPNGHNRRSRGGRGRGGAKKIVLVKLKPEPVIDALLPEVMPEAVTPEPVVEMPMAAEPVAASLAEARTPAKGRSNRNRSRGSGKATTETAPQTTLFTVPAPVEEQPAPMPVEMPTTVEATEPSAQPAPTPLPAPEAVSAAAVDTVAEAAAVAAKRSRTARTPAPSKTKGPVATPAQKVQAARQTKKTAVGALMLALGSTPAPAPALPVETPAPVPAPVESVAPPAPEPVAEPEAAAPVKAKAAPKRRAPSKPKAKPAS